MEDSFLEKVVLVLIGLILTVIIPIGIFVIINFPFKFIGYHISQKVCVYDNNQLIYEGKRYNITIKSAGMQTEYLRESTYLRIDEDYMVSDKLEVKNCK